MLILLKTNANAAGNVSAHNSIASNANVSNVSANVVVDVAALAADDIVIMQKLLLLLPLTLSLILMLL